MCQSSRKTFPLYCAYLRAYVYRRRRMDEMKAFVPQIVAAASSRVTDAKLSLLVALLPNGRLR
jgi:hypothetical protein